MRLIGPTPPYRSDTHSFGGRSEAVMSTRHKGLVAKQLSPRFPSASIPRKALQPPTPNGGFY
jgi:hypothetical protein